MKPISITREEVIIVGRRFAGEKQVPESRLLVAAEAWYDADRNHRPRDEQALWAYLKL